MGAASARAPGGAGARGAPLLLDTLRLRDPVPPNDLAARWHSVASRTVAAMGRAMEYEGAAAWLLRRLGDRGLLSCPPAALVDDLRRGARRDAVVAMRVDAQAETVLARLAEWGIPTVLLKGVARRAAATLYPYADARALLDVDLLVEEGVADGIERRLLRAGYHHAAPADATPPGHHHLRPLTLGGEPPVELHTSTSRDVPALEAWRRANDGAADLDWQGRRIRVPCATELLWHATAHALHTGPPGFRLRHYLDAAVVLASGRAIRWDRISERLRGPEVGDRALALRWLRGAAELAGTELPDPDGLGAEGAAPTGAPAPAGPRTSSRSPVLHALAWRLAVFGRLRTSSPWREKLLDEGTRAQLGLPYAPLDPSRSPGIGVRRRAAAIAGRSIYRLWRTGRSDD